MSYDNMLDLAAGGVLLAAVLAVWRRDLSAIVRVLLVAQGAALAAIPVIRGVQDHDRALIAVGVGVFAVRAVALPWLLARALGAERQERREATPLVSTAASLLVVTALVVAAFTIAHPVVDLQRSTATNAAPAAIATVLVALFMMATRRHAISQAVGLLMLDNGIAATAFLLTAGVPLIVELGASLDVLFVLIVLGVLTGQLRKAFGGVDLDLLRELRD
jgi:hydrogenase-4 component E